MDNNVYIQDLVDVQGTHVYAQKPESQYFHLGVISTVKNNKFLMALASGGRCLVELEGLCEYKPRVGDQMSALKTKARGWAASWPNCQLVLHWHKHGL
jgi:hypothetical protein